MIMQLEIIHRNQHEYAVLNNPSIHINYMQMIRALLTMITSFFDEAKFQRMRNLILSVRIEQQSQGLFQLYEFYQKASQSAQEEKLSQISKRMTESGLIPKLIEFMQDQSNSLVAAHSSGIIVYFSRKSRQTQILIESQIIDALAHILPRFSEITFINACYIIYNLTIFNSSSVKYLMNTCIPSEIVRSFDIFNANVDNLYYRQKILLKFLQNQKDPQKIILYFRFLLRLLARQETVRPDVKQLFEIIMSWHICNSLTQQMIAEVKIMAALIEHLTISHISDVCAGLLVQAAFKLKEKVNLRELIDSRFFIAAQKVMIQGLGSVRQKMSKLFHHLSYYKQGFTDQLVKYDQMLDGMQFLLSSDMKTVKTNIIQVFQLILRNTSYKQFVAKILITRKIISQIMKASPYSNQKQIRQLLFSLNKFIIFLNQHLLLRDFPIMKAELVSIKENVMASKDIVTDANKQLIINYINQQIENKIKA